MKSGSQNLKQPGRATVDLLFILPLQDLKESEYLEFGLEKNREFMFNKMVWV